MTLTAPVLHPSSVAAMLRSAEAHERAGAVLHERNPAASQLHADMAVGLRAKASPVAGPS